MFQISTESHRDRIVLGLHLLLGYFLAVGATCYVFLPFRHVKREEATNRTLSQDRDDPMSVELVYDNTEWTDGHEFQVIFYLSLGVGSLVGGAVGYFFSPERGTTMLTKLAMMISLVGACIIDYSIKVHHTGSSWDLLHLACLSVTTSIRWSQSPTHG